MSSLNKAMLIGNVGKDPEVRTTNGGKKIVSFSLATSERWKDRDGEQQERTEWHAIVVFNEKLGDVIERYVQKGSKLYIEGQIQTRKWQDKEGNDRYSTEIVLQQYDGKLVMLGEKNGNGARAHNDERPKSRPSTRQVETDLDDDVPF